MSKSQFSYYWHQFIAKFWKKIRWKTVFPSHSHLLLFYVLLPNPTNERNTYTLRCLGSHCFLHIAPTTFLFFWTTLQNYPDNYPDERDRVWQSARGGNIFHKQSHSGLKLIPLALKNEAINYTRGSCQNFRHAINPLNIGTDKLNNKFFLYFTYGLWSKQWCSENRKRAVAYGFCRARGAEDSARVNDQAGEPSTFTAVSGQLWEVVLTGCSKWRRSQNVIMSAGAIKHVVASIHLTTVFCIFI